MATRLQGAAALLQVHEFVGTSQRAAIANGIRGEEGQYFIDLVMAYADRCQNMPKVYEQDGKGDAAIVYLHYFSRGCDWYITERDTSAEQLQAFGFACLGDYQNAELGYIDIGNLIKNGVELDLHFKPRTLAECKHKLAA